MECTYRADTRSIIALCHIIDDFEEFEKKLKPMEFFEHKKKLMFQLSEISNGNFKIGARKAKKFYKENKLIIDTINQHTTLYNFIVDCLYNENNLHFFYKYIIKHKDKLKQILAVLEKLEKLGLNAVNFNEDIDFTKENYDIDKVFGNQNFDYFDNIEILPSDTSYIKYKTTNSNYRICLNIDFDCSLYAQRIELNSLLFDPNSLPIKIDKENTYDQILKLKSIQESISSLVTDSNVLYLSIWALEERLNRTISLINGLNSVKDKDKLIEILSSLEKEIEKLKTLGEEHDDSIAQQEPLLTKEVLEEEKSLYLTRIQEKNSNGSYIKIDKYTI